MRINKKALLLRCTDHVLPNLCAAWMLCGWIVPGLPFGRLLFRNFVELGMDSLDGLKRHVIVSVIGGLLLTYFALAKFAMIKQALWWGVVSFVLLHAFSPILYNLGPSALDRDSDVLLAVDAGMLAVIIASNIIGVITALCTVQACCALLLAHDAYIYSGTVERLGGTFGHPERLYVEMLFSIPLTIGLARTYRGNSRWVPLSSSLIQAIVLLLTWYRMAVIGLFFSGMYLCRRLDLRHRSVVAFICILFVGLTFLIRQHGRTNEQSLSYSNQGHGLLLRHGYDQLRETWLLGEGPDNSVTTIQAADLMDSGRYGGPGNMLLEWLVDYGIAGGLLFLALIVSIARSRYTGNDALRTAYIASWIGILVAGVTDIPVGISSCQPGNVIAGALLGGLLVNLV